MFKWLGRRKPASGEEDDPILRALNGIEENAQREIPYADSLRSFLESVPALKVLSIDGSSNGAWWAIFEIDLTDALAWRVVQELAYAVNNPSLTSKEPMQFFPKSPAPYLNGGPDAYLTWVIEVSGATLTPDTVAEILQNRLPEPVGDRDAWSLEA